MKSNKFLNVRYEIVIALFFILSLMLGFLNLLEESPFIDEAYISYCSKQNVSACINHCLEKGQLPTYSFLLNIWQQIFGFSLLATRALSVVCYAIPVLFIGHMFSCLGWRTRHVYLSLFIYVVSYANLFYAQDASVYSCNVLFATISISSLISYLKKPSKTNYLIYSAATIFLTLLHLFNGFVLCAEILFLAWLFFKSTAEERKRILKLGYPLALGMILAIVLFFVLRYGADPATLKMSCSENNIANFLLLFHYYGFNFFFDCNVLEKIFKGLLLFVFWGSCGIGAAVIIGQKKERNMMLLVFWAFLPALGILLATIVSKYVFINFNCTIAIRHRYLLFSSVPVYMIIGYAAGHIKNSTVRRITVSLLIVGGLVSCATYLATNERSDWQAAFNYVKTNIQADEKVICISDMYRPRHPVEYYMCDYYMPGEYSLETESSARKHLNDPAINGYWILVWNATKQIEESVMRRFFDNQVRLVDSKTIDWITIMHMRKIKKTAEETTEQDKQGLIQLLCLKKVAIAWFVLVLTAAGIIILKRKQV